MSKKKPRPGPVTAKLLHGFGSGTYIQPSVLAWFGGAAPMVLLEKIAITGLAGIDQPA